MSVLILDSPRPMSGERTDLAARICRDLGAWYRAYRPHLSADRYLGNLAADLRDPRLTVWDGGWARDLDRTERSRLDTYIRSRGGYKVFLSRDGVPAAVVDTWRRMGWIVVHAPVSDAALSAIYLGLEAQPKNFAC